MDAFIILNKNNETDSVIIFVHLPKTAGTTLHAIINKQYGIKHSSCGTWSPDLPIEQKSRIEVLRGHVLFGVHKYLPQKRFTYITILRNPIERVISGFYHIRGDKKYGKLHDLFNRMTLHEYVTRKNYNCSKGTPLLSTINLQTRILAGKNFEDDLEVAKKNLKKYFTIVGITERFDETLYIINKKLGWKIDSYKSKNVTLNKPSIKEISDKTLEIIKNKNQKDIELYNLANKLFDEQLQQRNVNL